MQLKIQCIIFIFLSVLKPIKSQISPTPGQLVAYIESSNITCTDNSSTNATLPCWANCLQTASLYKIMDGAIAFVTNRTGDSEGAGCGCLTLEGVYEPEWAGGKDLLVLISNMGGHNDGGSRAKE